MRISDCSSDVCSSDLEPERAVPLALLITEVVTNALKHAWTPGAAGLLKIALKQESDAMIVMSITEDGNITESASPESLGGRLIHARSEEHTSELQSLMRISYAVFC